MNPFLRLALFSLAMWVVILGAIWAFTGRSSFGSIAQEWIRLVFKIRGFLGA